MSGEVLRTFEQLLSGPDDRTYEARICGRRAKGAGWEAWIEFVPQDCGPVLRSTRETMQSDRRNLEGWASRLSRVYLEGSLRRTLRLEAPKRRPVSALPEPSNFEGPAPPRGAIQPLAPDDAALNPFFHYRKGENVLRSELRRLSTSELRTIVRAFDMEETGIGVDTLTRIELVELIVATVGKRTGGPRPPRSSD